MSWKQDVWKNLYKEPHLHSSLPSLLAECLRSNDSEQRLQDIGALALTCSPPDEVLENLSMEELTVLKRRICRYACLGISREINAQALLRCSIQRTFHWGSTIPTDKAVPTVRAVPTDRAVLTDGAVSMTELSPQTELPRGISA